MLGRGLLRLYLVLWLVWASVCGATAYRELATYLGYDHWTLEKAAERWGLRWDVECKGRPSSLECPPRDFIPSNYFVSEDQVRIVVPMFIDAAIKLPFIVLMALFICFRLLSWVIAGFKKDGEKVKWRD